VGDRHPATDGPTTITRRREQARMKAVLSRSRDHLNLAPAQFFECRGVPRDVTLLRFPDFVSGADSRAGAGKRYGVSIWSWPDNFWARGESRL
jgi:hypothetical protein